MRFILAALCLLSFQWPVSAEVRTSLPDQVDPARTYVFYLHGRIVEGAGPRPYDPRFGVYDYPAVLDALASRGAVVIASQREPDADPDIHAGRIVAQIERLLRAGVPERQVVVAGFSKGGMIARHVSAFLHRDEVRYVLLGACWRDGRDAHLPLSGRVLSVRETSDTLSDVSCREVADREPRPAAFEERTISTGKSHGAFYRPLPEWVEPVLDWIHGADPGQSRVLFDARRSRHIPVELYRPVADARCAAARGCPVAFLSPGYGLAHTAYRFLADRLAASGYLVVAVQGVLPGDPAPGNTGNLIADRTPMWQRGADDLAFVKATLRKELPGYDWSRLALIGHSNGGDYSALALSRDPGLASTLVTLDNRRFPLPRSDDIAVLSIRGADFAADPGVLPAAGESGASKRCIVAIHDSRHDDMNDEGPAWLRERIAGLVVAFLQNGACDE